MKMARFRNKALVLALSFAGVILQSDATAISSRLQIHIPQDLNRKGGYEHREALFGIPPYGGSIQQMVYYADDDLCDAVVDTHGGYPEREKVKGVMKPWKAPYILMVDRGGCTFVQKVRNAQRTGAAAVIIADTRCLCDDYDRCEPAEGEKCQEKEPIMADDGSGSNISIPSFLMFKQDADIVRDVLMSNQMVRMELAWALPTPDDRVEYELWSTPYDDRVYDFQKEFKSAAVALGKRAFFTPHEYIYDGMTSGCQSQGKDQCYNLCVNEGRYCAIDPDNELDMGISGADIVVESLRRACIWNIYGDDGVGVKWWNYINEFLKLCNTKDFFMDPKCAADAMGFAEVDVGKVNQCMDDSGGTDQSNKNSILEEELAAKETSGVVILPVAYVNGVAIRGSLEFPTIFKAICAGYKTGTEPEICLKCADCKDEHKCVLDGKCSSDHADGDVSKTTFLGSLVAVFFVFSCLGFLQYKRSQRQVREQVKGILAEYMPLEKEGNNLQNTSIADDDDGHLEIS